MGGKEGLKGGRMVGRKGWVTAERQRKADGRVWKKGIKGGIERRGDGWEEKRD